uniref:Recombinase A n=1 Tax=Pinguiococcus pyrenoidosus TaxID=172671 RepID=A0A7R9UET2_9STRA|eukprot:scaffold1220_cov259-Pinguiococcus_pyrenoidosus.AAC.129
MSAAVKIALFALCFISSRGFSGIPGLAPASRVSRLHARRGSASADFGSGDLAPDARKEALEGVMSNIERCYGRGSILKLGDNSGMGVSTTPSGSMTLDLALGGGYPKGRVIEIYGPESSGKTTLALHAIAEVQKAGGMAAFIDAEHALDPSYAGNLGVHVDNLLVSQPDSGEMALDIVDQLIRSRAVEVIVVDSVAALVPRVELDGDMTDQQIGAQARLMSKALRKITGSLAKSNCSVIFLNQLRSKVGVIYGSPEVTSGGNALKYYSSLRLDVRRKEITRENKGITVKVKVVKNKVAPPFRLVELDILFGQGIDTVASLLDAAEQMDIVTRRGSWYSFEGNNVSQGRLNMVDHLTVDRQMRGKIEELVRGSISQQKQEAEEEAARSRDLRLGVLQEPGNVKTEQDVTLMDKAGIPDPAVQFD